VKSFSKKRYFSLVIFALVFTLILVPFYESAYAYTNQHKVSVSSKEIQFGPAKIRIDYNVIIDVDRPSSLDPGESFTVTVSPRGGEVTYHVEVLGKTYSVPQNLNLGDQRSFSLVTGIDGYVSTSASSFVTISGPVSKSQQTLRWDYPTSQIIRSSVDNNVGRSGDVVVRIPIKINIDAGLNLNLLGIIKQNLGEKNLGTISAYPTIEERITIDRPAISSSSTGGSVFGLMILLIIPIIIIVIIIAVIAKRKKSKGESKKSSVSATPTFTYNTVKEIQKSTENKPDSIEKTSDIDSKSYWAYPIQLEKGDKLMGNVSGNGNFLIYLTDRSNFEKFQEKMKRDALKFYEGGRSDGFTFDFSYVIPHGGEFLLAILNEGKSNIHVKLDYFVIKN